MRCTRARGQARLRKLGLDDAADDLATWQLVRFLHESGELWDYEPGESAGSRRWVNEDLDTLLKPAPLSSVSKDGRVHRVLDGTRLVTMARLSFKGFDDIQLEQRNERPEGLERDRVFGEGAKEWRLDEVKLAHLLNLAARMALDSRRLPPVLAEHLGRDPAITALL